MVASALETLIEELAGRCKPSGEEELLAPAISAIAIAGVGVLFVEVEGVASLGVGEQGDGLGFKPRLM